MEIFNAFNMEELVLLSFYGKFDLPLPFLIKYEIKVSFRSPIKFLSIKYLVFMEENK